MSSKIVSHEQVELLRKDPEEFANLVVSVLNVLGNDQYVQEVASYIFKTHRTLQQEVMKLIVELMKVGAIMYQKGYYDLRNEATCKLCNEIVEMHSKNMNLPTI